MKINTNSTPINFVPFKVTIDVESASELAVLVALTNQSVRHVVDNACPCRYKKQLPVVEEDITKIISVIYEALSTRARASFGE